MPTHTARLLATATAFGVTIFAGTAMAQATPSCEPEKLAEKYPGLVDRTIRIGLDPQTAPYAMRDAEDLEKIVGVDTDLARAVFDCAGVPYEIVAGAWSGLLPAVDAGQIDVIWNNLYYNPARGEKFDFVIYMEAGSGGMTQAGNPKAITGLDSMCGTIAAVTLGGFEESLVTAASGKCVAEGKDPVELMSFQDVAAGVRLIDNQRADVLLWDAGVVDTLVGNNPEKYARAFMSMSGIKIGPAVRKDDGDLLKAIHDGLTVMQATGKQAGIFTSYKVDPATQLDAVILREE